MKGDLSIIFPFLISMIFCSFLALSPHSHTSPLGPKIDFLYDRECFTPKLQFTILSLVELLILSMCAYKSVIFFPITDGERDCIFTKRSKCTPWDPIDKYYYHVNDEFEVSQDEDVAYCSQYSKIELLATEMGRHLIPFRRCTMKEDFGGTGNDEGLEDCKGFTVKRYTSPFVSDRNCTQGYIVRHYRFAGLDVQNGFFAIETINYVHQLLRCEVQYNSLGMLVVQQKLTLYGIGVFCFRLIR